MINEATLAESIRRLRQGERATLAQAMTLVESRHPRHQAHGMARAKSSF